MAPEDPCTDYERRRAEHDYGDATMITIKELRENLAEIVNRVAFGGEYFVVTRHGKPLVAIVMPFDLQLCQALEDYDDAKYMEEMEASGELDKPGIPLDEVIKRHGPFE